MSISRKISSKLVRVFLIVITVSACIAYNDSLALQIQDENEGWHYNSQDYYSSEENASVLFIEKWTAPKVREYDDLKVFDEKGAKIKFEVYCRILDSDDDRVVMIEDLEYIKYYYKCKDSSRTFSVKIYARKDKKPVTMILQQGSSYYLKHMPVISKNKMVRWGDDEYDEHLYAPPSTVKIEYNPGGTIYTMPKPK